MIDAEELFGGFKNCHILVVGDVMIDRYLTGNVSRISPEAPVPVVELANAENRLGGAANVALNIAALGANVSLCSVIGDDEYGKHLLNLLPEREIDGQGVILSTSRMTTIKSRVMAGSQQLLRIDKEQKDDINEVDTKLLIAKIEQILNSKPINGIVFQDYNKGVISQAIIKAVIALAKAKNIPTVADPKVNNFYAFEGITMFKPNLKEIQESIPFDIQPNLDDLKKASSFIKKKLQNKHCMITLSEKGLYIDDQQNAYIMPTLPRSIADVCGAGDTVVSLAVIGLALDMQIKDIAILANLAGGQVCEKTGVVPVNYDQLLKEYNRLLSYKL